MEPTSTALITNDAIAFGLLMAILAAVFVTANSTKPGWQKFYTFVPSLLLCYFLPSLLTTFGIISAEESNLYPVASRYLLPASLVLLTLSVDIKGILNLGPKALIMFLAGTFGVMLGGPLALLIVGTISPEVVGGTGPDAVWRGLATVAGSWIGGGANQTAMKEIFEPSNNLFGAMVTVDIIVANIWMAVLLYGAGISNKIDKWFKADSTAIDELKNKVADYQANTARVTTYLDVVKIMSIAFILTALGHLAGDIFAPLAAKSEILSYMSLDSAFFWIIVVATTGGLLVSFTELRELEGAGASKFGTLFLYILVMTIGMQMDISSILNAPGYFVIGIIWIIIHVIIMLVVAKFIKAPFFFTAVGSQANIGGAASAPIVASAFHPALAPVGVLLAVLGYVLGTYGAYISALIMQAVSGM